MAIKTSGFLSFKDDIAAEYKDVAPHSLSEFYGVDNPIPTSGAISFSDFYGTSDVIVLTLAAGQYVENLDLKQYALDNDWNRTSKVQLIIPNDAWIWSDTNQKAGLIISDFPSDVIITNSGKIIGRGGNGGSGRQTLDAQPGGPAIYIDTPTNVYITNATGAFIAGGGGGGGSGTYSGGGGGAGGGFGGPHEYNRNTTTGGEGGAIDTAGSEGGEQHFGRRGFGGGAGGGGGAARKVDKKDDGGGSGGGGGRILPGVGGAGGETSQGIGGVGGSANAFGAVAEGRAGGGGGGWGAAGGNGTSTNGGVGGKAISATTTGNIFIAGTGSIYGATS